MTAKPQRVECGRCGETICTVPSTGLTQEEIKTICEPAKAQHEKVCRNREAA